MNSMAEIMIDIETMGTNPNAPILSIGAQAFDSHTGEVIGDGLHLRVTFDSAFYLRSPDPDTIVWWMSQAKEAQQALISGERVTIVDALNTLSQYINENAPTRFNDREIWANDPDFDLVILGTAYRQFHLKTPWPFWGGRSCRTVCRLTKGILSRRNFDRKGTHHDALDDCRYQIQYICEMVKLIRTRVLGVAVEV